RVRRALAHREEAGRGRSLRRSALRRREPVPDRDRAQHELSARDHRDRGAASPAPQLLLALEEHQARRVVSPHFITRVSPPSDTCCAAWFVAKRRMSNLEKLLADSALARAAL